MQQRREARHASDPDKYIRRVKGNRFQARPYDAVTGDRENLGLFANIHEARKAIREFWWGKRQPRPRFVTPIHGRRGTRYLVKVPSATLEGRKLLRLGMFASEGEAANAAWVFLCRVYGRYVAEAMMRRRDTSRRGKKVTVAEEEAIEESRERNKPPTLASGLR